MRTYSLRHLANSSLRHALKQLVTTDWGTTAQIVAHIAEFIARKLYLLTGISLLAPPLTEANAEDLLASSVHKTKREIQLLLAARFPQPDLPTFMASLGTAPAVPSPQVAQGQCPVVTCTGIEVCTAPVDSSALARIDDPVISVVTPLAPERFAWQLTVSQETQDLLSDAQDLLGHDVPPGDLEAVLQFALRTAKQKLEQRKFAATVGGIRLLCRAHDQFEAERVYGAEFMRHKREAARHRASEELAGSQDAAESAG